MREHPVNEAFYLWMQLDWLATRAQPHRRRAERGKSSLHLLAYKAKARYLRRRRVYGSAGVPN